MRVLTSICIVILSPSLLWAQLSEPQSFGLGGAGVSYLDGINALYTNPANLRFTNQNETFALEFLRTGFSRNTPNLFSDIGSEEDQLLSFFELNDPNLALSIDQNEAIKDVLLSNENQEFVSVDHQAELVWLRMMVKLNQGVLAVGLRSRFRTQNRFHRSWLDGFQGLPSNPATRSRSVEQIVRAQHEITLAYSSSLNMITGMFSNLAQLSFGVAPKLILPGAFSRNVHSSSVFPNISNDGFQQTINSRATQIGSVFTNYGTQALGDDPSINDFFSQNGWGLGLDMGLSLLIPFGDELPLINRNVQNTYIKGVRLSIAARDLGLIVYDRGIRQWSAEIDTLDFNAGSISAPERFYTGNIGAVSNLLRNDPNEIRALNALDETETSSYHYRIPPTIQFGLSVQLNRIQLLSEFSVRSNDLRLDGNTTLGHFGIELKPIRWLPLRAGVQIQEQFPTVYSLGLGLDTRWLQLNAGAQFLTSDEIEVANRILGLSVGLTISI